MSMAEQTGRRDAEDLYGAWHRPQSIRRFLPAGVDADSLGLINVDHVVRCERWAEYCRGSCSRIFALIETALGTHQTHKTATVTAELARGYGCEAFIVLVAPTDDGNDIDRFRVKRIVPVASSWYWMSPRDWAHKLVEVRGRADRCDTCPDVRQAAA